jgi:hypothetical protein
MATNVSISTDYNGEFLASLISKALLGGSFLQDQSNYTLHQNLKYKLEVNKFDISGILKPTASFCGITDSGDVIFDKVTLEPKKYAAELKFCYDDWYPTYQSTLMNAGANENDIPFRDYLVSLMIESIATDTENMLFNGSTAGTGGILLESFTGIITLAELSVSTPDAAVVVDASTSFALDTPENVLNALAGIYKAIPATIFSKEPRPRIYVSSNTYRLFQIALSGQMNVMSGQNFVPQGMYDNYMGIQVKEVSAMPDDKILAFAANNLHIGTDLLGDWASIRTRNLDDSDLSGYIKVQLRAVLDVKVGYYSEVVLGTYQALGS